MNKNTKSSAIESNTDLISRYAATLSLIEVGLGSIVHAVKLPLAGQILSMNQGVVLSHACGRIKNDVASACVLISSVAAVLKSLSPAGNKLGPMLSISAQGFLFACGISIFGTNSVGIIVGMCLLSTWAFIQPFITLYLFYGHQLITAFEFYLLKMKELIQINSDGILHIIFAVILIKFVIASALGVYFFRRGPNVRTYFENFTKNSKSSLTLRNRQSSNSLLKIFILALKDMSRPFFLISFLMMLLFFIFSNGEWSQIIWLSLRPLAIAFLFFFVSRHPWFYRFNNQLRRVSLLDNFFAALDRTIDRLESGAK